MGLREDTVDQIFIKLNKINNFRYCLIRNFDKLPKIDSDMDFIYEGPINLIDSNLQEIAISKWDILLKFERNAINFHEYRKFYIYWFLKFKKNKIEILQLDFGRSLLIFGIPYFKFENQLENIDINKNYRLLNIDISASHHIFQIEKLIDFYGKISDIRKFIKYKNIIINKINNSYFKFIPYSKLYIYLKNKNYLKFKYLTIITKFKFLFKIFFENPLQTIRMLFSRYTENIVVKKNLKEYELFKMKKNFINRDNNSLLENISKNSIILFKRNKN